MGWARACCKFFVFGRIGAREAATAYRVLAQGTGRAALLEGGGGDRGLIGAEQST